jgi:hypothetical protein
MSSEEQSDEHTREDTPGEAARSEWGMNAYVSWLTSSVGQDWIKAKKSLLAVQTGEDPPYRWPTDVRGVPLPSEGPLRIWVSGGQYEAPPDGWVHVNGFADLRHLMLVQLVVEFSMVDVHEAVDFIASNYYGYGTLFWPRDGLTARVREEERITALTHKIQKLTDFAEVELVITRNPQGHTHFHTAGRKSG